MRALIVIVYAAALAVLCAAAQTENPNALHALEEAARECSVAKAELADLQSHATELRAKIIARAGLEAVGVVHEHNFGNS